LKEVVNLLPQYSYIYLGDNARALKKTFRNRKRTFKKKKRIFFTTENSKRIRSLAKLFYNQPMKLEIINKADF